LKAFYFDSGCILQSNFDSFKILVKTDRPGQPGSDFNDTAETFDELTVDVSKIISFGRELPQNG
jgi:hypothetical protein